MKKVKELQVELYTLIRVYKSGNICMEEVAIKFNKLIHEFQLSSKTDSNAIELIKNSFKETVYKLEKTHAISEKLLNETNYNNNLRVALGLV